MKLFEILLFGLFSKEMDLSGLPEQYAEQCRTIPGLYEEVEKWRKTGEFPIHLYWRSAWPAPLWMLVPREQLKGRCPNCGSSQQMGQRDPFPPAYDCDRCGFNDLHPYANQPVNLAA